MSITTMITGSAGELWDCAVSGEVIDGLTDAVASRTDPVARAAVLTGMLAEIVESVTWRCADTIDVGERDSLRRLVAEAEAHRQRMLSSPHAR
jgi:hypothetical protein